MKRALENGKGEGDSKRACTDATNSDVDEFFALLQRIDETEKQLRSLRRVNKRQQFHRKGAPAWRPSFEWEDFCSSTEIRPRDVDPASACMAHHGISKERASLPNYGNTEIAKESLDLNLSPAFSLKEK